MEQRGGRDNASKSTCFVTFSECTNETDAKSISEIQVYHRLIQLTIFTAGWPLRVRRGVTGDGREGEGEVLSGAEDRLHIEAATEGEGEGVERGVNSDIINGGRGALLFWGTEEEIAPHSGESESASDIVKIRIINK